MAASQDSGIYGKWKVDLDKSDSPEELFKAQKMNALMIKMAKGMRVQQELKKISDDELLCELHIGKTIKIQCKTDHQTRSLDLEQYGKSEVACWWEGSNMLVMTVEYDHKNIGPCVETVSRSLIDADNMKVTINWKTKDGSHDITLNRTFGRK